MKLQKIGVLLMVIVMTLCAGLTVSAKDVSDYNDVHENDWHYSYVKDVSEQGLMTGLNDTTFGPSQKLARSQFATIIYRMYGSPQTSYKALFNDVTDGNFYSVPVTWASQFGVITGYTDGSGNFGSADDITREQLATMLYRYADKLGYDLSVSETANNFPDKSSVSAFAIDGMNWCISKGIITGDQGKINPQGTVNRAVCATMISRFHNYLSKSSSETDNPDSTPSQPDNSGSTPTKPDNSGSTPTKPDNSGSTPTKPDNSGSTPSKPDTTKPDTTEPDTTKPDPTEPDTTKPDPTEPDSLYSYELTILNKTELYDGIDVLLYIKTDNPDPSQISIKANTRYTLEPEYDDIHYTSDKKVTGIPYAVAGGYVYAIAYEEPMEDTIIVREITKRASNGYPLKYKIVASLPVTIHDYDLGKYQWAQGVIEEVVTPNMTNIEALTAIQTYLEENFKYLANDEDHIFRLAADVGPVWISKRVDCISAASLVYYFASTFYGLTDGKLTYAGYLNHYFLTLTVDGQEYYFEPYIPSSTGYIENESWEYIL